MIFHDDLEQFWVHFLSSVFIAGEVGPEMIFRGVSDRSHALIPSIGRHARESAGNDLLNLEHDLLTEFRRLALPELESIPNNDFEWLFLAQHYGLPTRLLDWSTNPLVALFFAVEKEDDRDGVVYMVQRMVTDQYELFDFRTAGYTDEKRKEPSSVFAIQSEHGEVIFIRPPYKDRRYQNQRSVFSCSQDPYAPLKLEGMTQIAFHKDLKPKLRERLRKMGVSASYIYPGLSGIAAEVKSLRYDPVQSGRMKIITLRGEINF